MNLYKLSVKRPVTVLMIILIVMVFSFISFGKLSIDLYPNIELPIMVVSLSYPNAGPYEMESLVVQPVERSLASVAGVSSTNSTSSYSTSMIILQMENGTDMNFASLRVRDRLSLVKAALPSGVSDPTIIIADPSMLPVMQIFVSEDNVNFAELKAQISTSVIPALESTDGVASASIVGSNDKQISITVDSAKLTSIGVPLTSITQALQANNLTLPGGSVNDGDTKLNIRVTGEFESVDQINDTQIVSPVTATPYRLGDIADISEEFKDRTSLSRLNGTDSLSISIGKTSNANTVSVSNAVKKQLDEIKKTNPNLDFLITNDQSSFIEMSLQNVASSAILGAVLAAFIIFIFLRNIRTTLIISASIPISILTTFCAMYFAGITLNLISLGGLALGIGMLVDNSIVVLECIYQHLQAGKSRKDAAIDGTKEVAMPVTASTLTTVAVFAPMMFITSITGQIFRELALTVIFSLSASLITALTLIPMFSAQILELEKPAKHRVFKATIKSYEKLLAVSLKHRVTVVIITFILFASAIVMAVSAGAEFMPSMDQGTISVTVTLPRGTRLDITEQALEKVEAIVDGIPEIDHYSSTTGSGMSFAGGGSTNSATVNLSLVPKTQRSRTDEQITDDLREKLSKLPSMKTELGTGSMSMGTFSSGVSISIYGNDLNVLNDIANNLIDDLNKVEGLREIKSSIQATSPEVKITVNEQETAKYGLSTAIVAGTLNSIISGQTATRFKLGGTEMDVVIKTDEIKNIAELESMMIQTPTGQSVSLSKIAKLTQTPAPVSITRENGRRVVSVSASIVGRNTSFVGQDIDSIIQSTPLPAGYQMKESGGIKQLNDSLNDMGFALIIAVVLVFMIIAAQFESLIHPVTIMVSIPFSFTGAFLLLFVCGMPLSVPALIGLIVLAGVVVNNAIVLVDFIRFHQHEEKVSPVEAALSASPTRLRPVLMTTLTTILGLVPMALSMSEGTEMEAPLAISVIGGLALSTVLTLIVIPVIYTLFEDTIIKIKNKKERKNRRKKKFLPTDS